MNKSAQKSLYIALLLLAAFTLWTAAVCLIDVKPVGPMASSVGFAALNSGFHDLTGVHMALYHITDWLSLVPVGFCLGFALLGLIQWITRKHLLKVDFSILVLGGFYLAVMAVYVLFEKVIINHRPVLIDGALEASYPSSTTMLVLCVLPTAILQLRQRIRNRPVRRFVCVSMAFFTLFMFAGRLLSGVHWLTDIIGGALVSAGLVTLYHAICRLKAS